MGSSPFDWAVDFGQGLIYAVDLDRTVEMTSSQPVLS
jgi:hypothetical protein